MINPNPECPREDCRFEIEPGVSTLAYYKPIYDKNGVNINPDMNNSTFNVYCGICNKAWRGRTQMNQTTYEEVSNG
jgi:hypothetical protein